MPFILNLLLLVISSVSAGVQSHAESPSDFAISLRETYVKASLEVYAGDVLTAQPKQFFPVLSTLEDQHGIRWAEVKLPDGTSGFLTDMIIVRKRPSELEKILQEVAADSIENWSQDTVDEIQDQEIEVGMSRTQLLFALGLPSSSRMIGDRIELSFPRVKVLLKEEIVCTVTKVTRLPLDKMISLAITMDDPEFAPTGGSWNELPAGTEKYMVNASGTGVGKYHFRLPADGSYKVTARWLAAKGNSPDVRYRISSRGTELAEFKANHRLYGGRSIELGIVRILGNQAVSMEVYSGDGLPFSIGTVEFKYENDPLPEVGTVTVSGREF